MVKPSIAELLNASGYTTYTAELVQRAMFTLYGNVGANQDGRNWAAILQSNNPLEAAEAGLRAMYQDGAYLRSNTQHLEQSGYVAAQAEITYRQLAERLDFTHQPGWSVGTVYEYLGPLSTPALIALVPVMPEAPPAPLPTISVASSAAGFTVSLNVAGTVKMSVSGDLGSFTAGTTVLTQQATIKEGFLTLSSNGNTSAATSQYVVLGTAGNDSIDTSAAGNQVDYIFGGAGNDTLKGGAGNDVIVGGAGNDTITGGAGADKINGGAGSDSYKYAVASESNIINAASTATGFDTVTITSGDIFDFISDVTAVRVDEYYVGQSPQANGDALLVQLNSFYQSAGPSAGVDAMYISIGNNAKGRFLVVDTDDNNQITSNDLIIEIVGITANKNIQLGLSGGNVVMNEVDPPEIAP